MLRKKRPCGKYKYGWEGDIKISLKGTSYIIHDEARKKVLLHKLTRRFDFNPTLSYVRFHYCQ